MAVASTERADEAIGVAVVAAEDAVGVGVAVAARHEACTVA